MNSVDKVINIALAEEGYLEKSTSAYKKNPAVLDSKKDGAGKDNYTKYGRDMHNIYPAVMDFPAAWCDAFVDWCFYKAWFAMWSDGDIKHTLMSDLNGRLDSNIDTLRI